jgi:hypothetical protein
LKINIKAPIIPGESIGEIKLGININQIENFNSFKQERVINEYFPDLDLIIYKTDLVNFYVEKGIITQIMAHGNYLGKLNNLIGIGSTMNDIEKLIGPVDEDNEDNLIIEGIKGLCFDFESGPIYSNSTPIAKIYVFPKEFS